MFEIERLPGKSSASLYRFQSEDDAVGGRWTFQTAQEVSTFFWGRDAALYRVSKDGRDLGTPTTGDLNVLTAWLEQEELT